MKNWWQKEKDMKRKFEQLSTELGQAYSRISENVAEEEIAMALKAARNKQTQSPLKIG